MLGMRDRKHSPLGDERGTALVEFAIALPLLVIAALGIIEIGRYTAYAVLVGNATRAGAQVGAMGSTYALAPPDSGQPNSGLDSLPSQAACNDSGLSCTSTGTGSPSNKLRITTAVYCTYSNATGTSTSCPTAAPGVTRNMYIQVSAQGTYTSLLHYPLLPNTAPMSAQTTMQISP